MARTTEYIFTTEAEAKTHRRDNINAGHSVSLIGYDSNRDVYAYDVHDQDQDQDNVWVCECCALWIGNGDESGCRDYYKHTHPNCDPAIIHLTDEMFTVGYFLANCNGCGMIQRTGATMYAAIRLVNN